MKRLLLLSIMALLPACQQQPKEFQHNETIAGIDHTLWIIGVNEKTAQRASSAVFSELRLLSKFTQPIRSKPMARTNILLRSGEWFSVNPSMTGILKESVKYYGLTNGLFNPAALGALREAWGVYADPDIPAPPKEKDLQALLTDLPTMNDIQFDAIRMRGNNKHIRLDFDYFAYGYAVDTEIQHLKDLGIQNARLQIDGVDRVIGSVPGTAGRAGPAECERSIPQMTGTRRPPEFNHVLNPRTGRPVENVSKIKVAADTASDAAVACWALLVGDPGSRPELVTRLNVASATITDASGEFHVVGK
ncbi:MAG: FAD:protein FMN transferase [Acidiferrobacterales bacterium]|nr:FAD:protein FMN transferase [Acidiferrobacterales bacterium]